MTEVSHDPELWQERADVLRDLLRELAVLRSNATVTYADAYIAVIGTDRYREQVARKAAASDKLKAEEFAAGVAAYQVMLTFWQADLAASPHPVDPLGVLDGS